MLCGGGYIPYSIKPVLFLFWGGGMYHFVCLHVFFPLEMHADTRVRLSCSIAMPRTNPFSCKKSILFLCHVGLLALLCIIVVLFRVCLWLSRQSHVDTRLGLTRGIAIPRVNRIICLEIISLLYYFVCPMSFPGLSCGYTPRVNPWYHDTAS